MKVGSIEASIFRNIDEIGKKKICGNIAVAGDIEMLNIDKIEDVAILLASNEIAYWNLEILIKIRVNVILEILKYISEVF